MHSDIPIKDKAKGLGILLFLTASAAGLAISLVLGVGWVIEGFIK